MPKKIYITTAIPYVNAEPHLGHVLEFIQADCVARYQRLIGNEVFFISGADENSLKNVLAAEKAGVSVQDWVNKHSDIIYSLKDIYNISFDDFVRTTQLRHVEGAQKMWLSAKDDIYQGSYEGLYCVGCEDFYKEADLIDGCCPEHKTKPETVKEENYFFRLSKYQKQLEEIYQNNQIGIYPGNRKSDIHNFLKEGLRDFSVSRSQARAHNWGIPVPNDKSQAIYVWFDALCNYVTVLGYAKNSPLFRAWWEDESTEVWHFIGKNISKFHCIYWPAMLMAAKLRLPSKIIIHGFVTLEGEKMSKSLGNVLDPFELAKEYGSDVLRYYILREFSLAQDGDFNRATLLERYNKELANGLGNLLSRVLALMEKNGSAIKPETDLLKVAIAETWQKYNEAFSEFKINLAVDSFLQLITKADAFVNEKQIWKIENKEELNQALSSLWLVLANLSFLVEPFMPETSKKIKESLGIKNEKKEDWPKTNFEVRKTSALFPRKQ
ncbi:MAG: methionine--tRNA ligase [Candidatus Pacebacteria bacterium]|nr:methionine--tRNA ligase [Candidatus Paceibacterota bacterium]